MLAARAIRKAHRGAARRDETICLTVTIPTQVGSYG